MLPKYSEYRKSYDKTKYMSFLIKDNELFGIKSAKLLKKNLIVSLYKAKNI